MTQPTPTLKLDALTSQQVFETTANEYKLYIDIYLDWFKDNEPEAYQRFLEAWERNDMGVQ